jgi:beta-phosphoglucomutase
VLDFNGTLADDGHIMAPLFVELFASLGLELTVEQYHRDLAAISDRDTFTRALESAGLPFDEGRLEDLIRARRQGYLEAVAQQPPVDAGAREFVRAAAAADVALAIASGAFREEIESVLRAAELDEWFSAVVAIDDVVRGKPDPEGFRVALARLNEELGVRPAIQASEVVAVEDATDGAQAAREAGMHVAAVRGPGYDEASGYAELVIERLEPGVLEAMLALAGPSAG